MAICAELRSNWVPARLEQAYQRDRFTLFLGLRTLQGRGWLLLSWHPQAARICLSSSPPRNPDTFTFSQQLRHQIGGLALVGIQPVAPWERALDLQFAQRPGDPPLWHLYVEIMGKYSNVILVNQDNQIVTAAHQVSSQQSSLRPIQTGNLYELPPQLTDPIPTTHESIARWRERLALIPGPVKRNLVKTYRGLSSALVLSLLAAAEIDGDRTTDSLTDQEWEQLFDGWQTWLHCLEKEQFQPGWTSTGYTVMGWQLRHPVTSVNQLIDRYYAEQGDRQAFSQLHHQLSQKLKVLLDKLQVKAQGFRDRLAQSDQAEQAKDQADLLMAHLQAWQPGMTQLQLPDFITGQLVTIALNPEKNAVQNAQALYKRHQKLKRAKQAIEPLLAAVEAELHYLEQVDAAVAELDQYHADDDLQALQEIREELVQQQYWPESDYRSRSQPRDEESSQPHRYSSPNGLEVLVGRNNRQNDYLTFRIAGDYDLWLHTQEIPGSHVLLRLQPGMTAEPEDLQFGADLAAYYSRARHSEQVPVVYTEPKNVYKPRGAKPGMTVYKHEKIIWAQPQRANSQSSAEV